MSTDKRSRILEFLAQESIFSQVSRAALERLAPLGHVREVPRGKNLFSMGQRCSELHFVMEGQAKVILLSKDGRERILHVALPGDMVGAVPFFDGRDYPCTVTAETDSLFLAFRRGDLVDLLARESEVTLGILGGLVARQRKIVQHLEELSFDDTSSRLWHYLVENSHSTDGGFPRVLDPLPTREKIAGEIGTVREVVSRRLSQLVKAGHVELDGRRLTLLRAPSA